MTFSIKDGVKKDVYIYIGKKPLEKVENEKTQWLRKSRRKVLAFVKESDEFKYLIGKKRGEGSYDIKPSNHILPVAGTLLEIGTKLELGLSEI